ncbi:MAG: MFS transporter [Bacteroidota bacterium]
MIERLRARLSGQPAGEEETGGDPDFRRNFALGVANGVLYNNGLSFFNRTTIIPVFMASLGAPSILISLTALFEALGWHLPQLIASKYIVHKPRKMALYGWAAVIRVGGLLVATGAACIAASSPGLALILFVLGYGIFSIAGGFAGLVFMEIVAKTCPKERRGSYFGLRAIFSGLVGLYLGVNVIKPVFADWGYPYTFMIAFGAGTLLIAGSFYLFTRQREPLQGDLPPERSMRAQFSTALALLAANRPFRRFVLFRGLMMLWFAGIPYYMLFARERLGASEAEMGTFISWEFAGLIVANLLWSYLSNNLGNRILLIIACALGVLVSAAVLGYAIGLFGLPAWTFGAIFFASAAVDSGVGTGGINYALEIIPEGERPTYIGLMNTLLAMALGLAAIAGGLRDLIGYIGLYVMTGGVALIALGMILRLPEPRRAVRVRAVRG